MNIKTIENGIMTATFTREDCRQHIETCTEALREAKTDAFIAWLEATRAAFHATMHVMLLQLPGDPA